MNGIVNMLYLEWAILLNMNKTGEIVDIADTTPVNWCEEVDFIKQKCEICGVIGCTISNVCYDCCKLCSVCGEEPTNPRTGICDMCLWRKNLKRMYLSIKRMSINLQ